MADSNLRRHPPDAQLQVRTARSQRDGTDDRLVKVSMTRHPACSPRRKGRTAAGAKDECAHAVMRPAGNPAGVAEVLEMVPLSGHPGDDILAVWQARARLPAIPIRKIVGNQPAAASGSTSGPVTPMSEVEQFRNFTSGLARQAGWRRNAARIGAVAILLLIVAGLVAGILASG